MGRPGISYVDVANAAQQIIASGHNPTIESIRFLIKTGSSGTIAQHLRTWKTKQDGSQQLAIKEKLPEEFVAVMKGLWEKLVGQADEQVNTIQTASEQKIIQLQQLVETLERENHQGQQQLQQLKQQSDSLSYDKVTLEQLMVNHQTENNVLQTKYEGVIQQLQEKQARIDELHHQNQQIQINLEHYRDAVAEQRDQEQQRNEQRQRQLEYTIEQLNQTIKRIGEEKNVIEKQGEQLSYEKTSFQKTQEQLIAEVDKLQQQILQAGKEQGEHLQIMEQRQVQCQRLEIENTEQRDRITDFQQQIAILSEQLSCCKQELKEMCEQNKSLAHEKWIIAEEKAQLKGQLKQMEAVVSGFTMHQAR